MTTGRQIPLSFFEADGQHMFYETDPKTREWQAQFFHWVPFVKSAEPHLLNTYAPEITKAFITSRLESVAIVVRDNLDDPPG